ncbi:MAG: MBL fold metallo-hydrolase [Ignavibacteriae bacterium]|nr:MBL fold metallo-hydrolase [Ignavibacteriota bacterium]MCB9217204.1 MBL fold metallo-hydrolase [Ignavibacteria bacterium]
MKREFIGDVAGKFKVALKDDSNKTIAYLLWGDSVRVISKSGSMVKVSARGRVGWIAKDILTDTGLLELYVIDVGQGDCVLMRTPNNAWHLIDAGVSNETQMTKKGAANFIRWKFLEDLEMDRVKLENVILSHMDFDHYGGLIDLFSGKVSRPDRTFDISVENFYHNGMGRFKDSPKLGTTISGTVPLLPYDDYRISRDDHFIIELLSGKASFKKPSRPFEPKSFAPLARLVGKIPKHVRSISASDQFLPGYDQNSNVVIRVLGPILEHINSGKVGLRELGSESITCNGHSIVLRIDYGKSRILLTGDLNTISQRLLLSYHDLLEFSVDVAKGCHHGSDDIDIRFVRAMKARSTIVSSGDNEDYAHPRPRVMGASARYGREAKSVKGHTLPPLLYSTELARSVQLAYADTVRSVSDRTRQIECKDAELKSVERGAKFIRMENLPVATDLIYGLINVRTDGERIMCAYMKEQSQDFDVQVFQAGVEP